MCTAPHPAPHPSAPEAVKKLNGRGALLRVRDGKPNTDAEHRVPTRITFIRPTEFPHNSRLLSGTLTDRPLVTGGAAFPHVSSTMSESGALGMQCALRRLAEVGAELRRD